MIGMSKRWSRGSHEAWLVEPWVGWNAEWELSQGMTVEVGKVEVDVRKRKVGAEYCLVEEGSRVMCFVVLVGM